VGLSEALAKRWAETPEAPWKRDLRAAARIDGSSTEAGEEGKPQLVLVAESNGGDAVQGDSGISIEK